VDGTAKFYFACLQLKPGARALTTDVCVPISRLAECIAATHADIANASIPIPILGHVSDGNFHLVMLINPDSERERHETEAIDSRLVRWASAMDGTCTGEHGIGLGGMRSVVNSGHHHFMSCSTVSLIKFPAEVCRGEIAE
jgi:D-lactate dehydrogenase (cytochrome)